MPFFRPERLARTQARMVRTLDGGSCTIQRATTSTNAIGGQSPVWSTVATIAAHSVGPVGRSPAERVIADKLTAEHIATISLPAGSDVRQGDRIVSGGRTWGVAGIVSGHTNTLLMQVVASRTDGS